MCFYNSLSALIYIYTVIINYWIPFFVEDDNDNDSTSSVNNENQVASTSSKKTTERKTDMRTDPKKAIRIGPTSKGNGLLRFVLQNSLSNSLQSFLWFSGQNNGLKITSETTSGFSYLLDQKYKNIST